MTLSKKTLDEWFSDRTKVTPDGRKCVESQPESRPVEVTVDLSKWIDGLFSAVDIEAIVKEVLEGLDK